MESKHTIVYVMQKIDYNGNIDIPYKKIGVTGKGNADLSTRFRQLNRTKDPLGGKYVAAWEHDKAFDIESALHRLLFDSRTEGEWFLDKDETLLSRIEPIMNLLDAKRIEIPEAPKKRSANRNYSAPKQSVEMNQLIDSTLDDVMKKLSDSLEHRKWKGGISLLGNSKELTYKIKVNYNGLHQLTIARSKSFFINLSQFLEGHGYSVKKTSKGSVYLLGLKCEEIAMIIQLVEKEFHLSK